MTFTVHTVDSAPEGSKPTLRAIESRYGFLPNLAATIAESPGALQGVLSTIEAFDSDALSLTAIERQVVLIATSVENRCHFCVAAHSMLAHSLGFERAEIDRLQQQQALSDPRLEALRRFTTAVVAARGFVDDSEQEGFFAAGFTRGQVFEVVLGVAIKTLTNYSNHIAGTEVNAQFAAFQPSWSQAA